MLTKKNHLPYKDYAQMIVAKCNTITRNNLIINIEVVEVNHGIAHNKDGEHYITIPVWAISRGYEFFTQYVIHEYNHHNVGLYDGHSDKFKSYETLLCQRLINCNVVYAKAYVVSLINRSTGEIKYNNPNCKRVYGQVK